MRALRYMILANFKMTLRNRTALFWNLAFPAIFIVLFGFLLTMDTSGFSVGVVGADTTPISQQVADELSASEAFDVETGSRESELQELEDGERSVVVIFSEGASPELAEAEIFYDQTDPQQAQIALSAVQQFLNQVNVEALGEQRPVTVSIEGIDAENLRYIDYLVPGILAMSLMNSGMIGLATAFVSYREKGILRRVKATPFPLSSFIIARIISQVVVAVIQAMVLILLGMLLFDLKIDGSLLNVVVMVTIGAVAFLSLGFVISSFARNSEAAASLSNAFSFPMLFLSGVFFPVDDAPAWLQPITKIIPLTYLADGLRAVMVRGSSLPAEWLNIVVLLLTCVVGLVLSLRFFRWESSPA
ncbi:MAG TPA: ABC transporter permease [Thermomicrobiales bacterium]|nr:ABC transporter permease [Thermomicrobiales bacterium]